MMKEISIRKPGQIQQQHLWKLDHMFMRQIDLFYKIAKQYNSPFDSGIIRSVKGRGQEDTDPRKGEYGYYASGDPVSSLVPIFNHLGVRRVVDLGSGPGFLLEAVASNTKHPMDVEGYEIEMSLVKLGKDLGHRVKLKDILQLEKEDLEHFGAIYFYEPMYSQTKAEEFVQCLEKVVENQYLLYNQAGMIGEYLRKSEHFQRIGKYRGIQIWKRP